MTQYLTHVGKHPYNQPQAGDIIIDDFARSFHLTAVRRVRLTTWFDYQNPGEQPASIDASTLPPDYRIYRYREGR